MSAPPAHRVCTRASPPGLRPPGYQKRRSADNPRRWRPPGRPPAPRARCANVRPMANPLWAPWRMEYILGPKDPGRPCIFCGIAGASQDELRARQVVCVTGDAFVMLNRYPFASGHLLIVPHAHVHDLEALDPSAHDALFRLVREAAVRLRRAVRAEA